MLTLPNYEIIKKIHQSPHSVIYRGLRHQDKKPVIIKLLNAEYPTVTALSYYRQEYDIIKNLDLDGVIKAYSLEHYQNTLMILLEDFGGEALKTLLTHASFRQNYLDCIPSFLSLALQITHCLSQIHAQNIIHKTLNPSHIVFNPLTQQVKLIDFSASSLFNDDKLSEGHWAYMAPEQSGRMNRSLDYHTDLYALGVIFYELLSGQLPFNGQTPLEFIHCHLAKIPTPIQMLNSQIPEILNHIVMKLMAKNVADRYQSALGLQYDLQYCWQQWQSSQKLKTFVLARHDVIAKLYIPQKLYGRETEIQQLRHLFNRVTQGSTEIVVIRGYSGVGKTALVQELHQLEHQGYFATGKFDQYQRDRPYLGLSYALDELYHYLLMESPQQLQHWQTEISAAVGTPILGHMMPQFQWVVEQPTSEGTDVAQVLQTRFHSAFQNFLKVFTHKQQPLILFLDDIQWADAGSLELLTELLTQAHTRYLLIILAYRNHELNHNQTVTRLLNALKTHPQALTTLELDNLAYPHLAQLIQDTFPKIPQQRLNPLIELIYQKTQGNPYFTKAFLKSLYEEQQLRFDRQQQLWQWDLEQIAKKSATYNVIDFLAQKITQLALETQELLKLAAIIGHQFDLKTLTVIHQQDPETTLALLWPAIEAGLILPLTAKHHHLMVIQRPLQEEANDNIHYRFQHDRVRQAICSLMAETDKQHLHYHIGQLLFTHTHHLEERIFEIVDHFNLAIAWIEAAEKKLIANLNLQAAQKAQAASAYTSALNYIHAGLSLLSPQSWHSDYELNLQLHLLAIELELIHSNWEQAHYYAQQVLSQAQTPLDAVKVFELRIQAALLHDQPQTAQTWALISLEKLSIKIPKYPWQLRQYCAQYQQELATERIETFSDLAVMTQAEHLIALRILNLLAISSYRVKPLLWQAVILTMVHLCRHQGQSVLAAYAYGYYAMFLCGVVREPVRGYQFGQLALQVLKRFHTGEYAHPVTYLFHVFIQHTRQPLSKTLMPLPKTRYLGLEFKEVEYAFYYAMLYGNHLFYLGEPLEQVYQQQTRYKTRIAVLKPQFYHDHIHMWQQMVAILIGQQPLNDLILAPKTQDNFLVLSSYCCQTIGYYFFKYYSQAAQAALQGQRYKNYAINSLLVYQHTFYHSLALLAHYPNVGLQTQKSYLNQVRRNQKQLKLWAQSAPANFQHQYDLVAAEYARVLQQPTEAMKRYEHACQGAQASSNRHEEALAYELASQFYLAQGLEKIAQSYLIEACYRYQLWGAHAKVKALQTEYHHFLKSQTPWFPSQKRRSSSLDLNSLMKAALTLSKEIILSRLLEKLMHIVIENGGAEKGFLILPHYEHWLIEAEAHMNQAEVKVLHGLPLEHSQKLSAVIVYYVIHTQTSVILNYAAQESRFYHDPYIIHQQPKSILAIPLIYQSHLSGVLYLENNLTPAAFTPLHLEMLELLSSQMAISIGHAKLYSELSESEQRFRVIAETSPIPLIISRPDDGAILYVNAQIHSIYGLSPKQLIGHYHTTDFYAHPAERQKLLVQIQQHGYVHHYEVQFKKIDQTPIWVDLFIRPIMFKNEPALLTAVYDMTDRKRVEEERIRFIQEREAKNAVLQLNEEIQAQKEELACALAQLQAAQQQLVESEKMSSLCHLVAGVAHEINTPIGISVTGISQMESLTQNLAHLFEHKQLKRSDLQKYLDNANQINSLIFKNLTRAAELISSFKQVAVDQSSEQQRQFNLNAYLHEIINSLKPELKQLRPQILIDCDQNINLYSYPGVFCQIITNLVMNSLIHGVNQQKNAIINLRVHQQLQAIKIIYSDNGQGMPPATLKKIFEPFFTTNRHGGGSGLGLHIVYNLVTHKLNGTIHCTSSVGQGTTFTLTLPFTE